MRLSIVLPAFSHTEAEVEQLYERLQVAREDALQSELWIAGKRIIAPDGSILETRPANSSAAVNLSVAAAQATSVLLLDAPALPSPEAIRKLTELIDSNTRCVEFRELVTSRADVDGTFTQVHALLVPKDVVDRLQGLRETAETVTIGLHDLCERIRAIGLDAPIGRSGDLDLSLQADLPEEQAGYAPQGDRVQERSVVANIDSYSCWGVSGQPPLVSVVIATRNRAEYLRDSINSVLFQTFPNFELLVVDDGSTDHTAEIVRAINDSRVRYIKQDARGISAARNRGIEESRGFYTAVHDDDDIMMPYRLAVSLESMTPGVRASYGAWTNFDDASGKLTLHVTRERFCPEVALHNGQSPGHSTWLIETAILALLKYNEGLTSAVDHNLALRSLRVGVKWRHTGRVMFLRRMHSKQVSVGDASRQKSGAIMSRYLLGYAATQKQLADVTARQSDVGWPKIREQAALERHLSPFLPDHLVERHMIIRGAALKRVRALSALHRVVSVGLRRNAIGAELEESAAVFDVTLHDLVLARAANVHYELLTAPRSESSRKSWPEVHGLHAEFAADAARRSLTRQYGAGFLLLLPRPCGASDHEFREFLPVDARFQLIDVVGDGDLQTSGAIVLCVSAQEMRTLARAWRIRTGAAPSVLSEIGNDDALDHTFRISGES